jgi:hypothetical protein
MQRCGPRSQDVAPPQTDRHLSVRTVQVLTLAQLALVVLAFCTRRASQAAPGVPDLIATATVDARAYLPFIAKPYACPRTSTSDYDSGIAYQRDYDNPVRPAVQHADKNIALRGYTLDPDPTTAHDLVNYGSDDDTQPPQFATLFDPARVPLLTNVYRVHHWDWEPSPDPGNRSGPILDYPVTALGMRTAPGEPLHVPASGYDIGGHPTMEVLVLFADEDTVTLRYTRDDSSAPPGYTVHVDNLCTDANLLALYRELDDAGGPRYKYRGPDERPYSYPLPNLSDGQPLGTARGEEIVVAVADTGSFQDPRSLNEWWQIRPGTLR